MEGESVAEFKSINDWKKPDDLVEDISLMVFLMPPQAVKLCSGSTDDTQKI